MSEKTKEEKAAEHKATVSKAVDRERHVIKAGEKSSSSEYVVAKGKAIVTPTRGILGEGAGVTVHDLVRLPSDLNDKDKGPEVQASWQLMIDKGRIVKRGS